MVDILIIEDNELNALLLKEICLSLGFFVCLGYSCKQAKKMIKERAGSSFDMILVDLCLPDGNGVLLAKEIKKMKGYEHIPFILLSGISSLKERMALDKIFVAKVSKPIEIKELKDVLLKLTLKTFKG